MLYFDHNATTPLLPEAREAWLRASEELLGNPSSPHRIGARADAALEAAREKLAGFLGCEAADIVWTSGATEANNMVLNHYARTLPQTAEIWVSAVEHPCVLEAAAYFFPKRHRLIPVSNAGIIELDWLRTELKKNPPALIAVMAANNETGVLQPWREVLSMCRSADIPFFCDAAQWIGKLPSSGLGSCDFVSGCAHKFGGPKGVGFLKVNSQNPFRPLMVGGKQEGGRRAGTENVAGVCAMIAALEQRESLLKQNQHQVRIQWHKNFECELRKHLPGTVIVGQATERLWNTVSAIMPEVRCDARWVVRLDKFGFAVSTGSACASGQEKPSHVLSAMGFSPDQTARALRFSSGWETTEADWTHLREGLVQAFDSFRRS